MQQRGDHLLGHLSTSFSTACPVKELERWVKDSASTKKEAETLRVRNVAELGSFTDLADEHRRWSFLLCKSRPTEAMRWVNEIESAKSVADVKKSYSITEAKLQTNFEVLGSEIASGLKKVINGEFKRRAFSHEEKNTFSRQGRSHG